MLRYFCVFICLLFISLSPCSASDRFRCGVCEALVDEVHISIAETKTTHTVQTRFRVDEKKHIPYARTEHNLLEIMEDEHFPKKFDKYGVIKPFSKHANERRAAYKRAVESDPTSTDANIPLAIVHGHWHLAYDAKTLSDTAEPINGNDQPDQPSDTNTQAPHTKQEEASATHASPPSPPPSPIITSDSIRSEIRSTLSDFLEEHLDEAMLMFHKDVPDIKQKLCYHVTEACKPVKKRQSAKSKSAAGGSSKVKDEL